MTQLLFALLLILAGLFWSMVLVVALTLGWCALSNRLARYLEMETKKQ